MQSRNSSLLVDAPLVKKSEKNDASKEAKEEKARTIERMKEAKAAEEEAARTAVADTHVRKEDRSS